MRWKAKIKSYNFHVEARTQFGVQVCQIISFFTRAQQWIKLSPLSGTQIVFNYIRIVCFVPTVTVRAIYKKKTLVSA